MWIQLCSIDDSEKPHEEKTRWVGQSKPSHQLVNFSTDTYYSTTNGTSVDMTLLNLWFSETTWRKDADLRKVWTIQQFNFPTYPPNIPTQKETNVTKVKRSLHMRRHHGWESLRGCPSTSPPPLQQLLVHKQGDHSPPVWQPDTLWQEHTQVKVKVKLKWKVTIEVKRKMNLTLKKTKVNIIKLCINKVIIHPPVWQPDTLWQEHTLLNWKEGELRKLNVGQCVTTTICVTKYLMSKLLYP